MTQTELKEYIRETVNDDLKANLIIGSVEAYSSASNCGKPPVSGSLLESLHKDLVGFQEMRFLTPDAKTGLGIAIEQVERYMRGELEARQQ